MRTPRPSLAARSLLAALAVLAAGCGSSSSTSTTAKPSPPPVVLMGVVHVEGPSTPIPSGDYDVDVDVDGSYRVVGSGSAAGTAYGLDQASLTRTVLTTDSGKKALTVTTGAPLTRPDSRTRPPMWYRDLADYVVGHHLAGDAAVTSTTFLGRLAWSMDIAVSGDRLGTSPDHAVAIVDAETYQPVSEVLTRHGKPFSSAAYTEVETAPSKSSALRYDVRDVDATAPITSTFDMGFRLVDLGQVQASVGYAPLRPAALPAGTTLKSVAVRPGTGTTTGAEGAGPPSVDAVELDFANGWRHLSVTTRRTGSSPDGWGDLFASEGTTLPYTVEHLSGGALDGATGQSVDAPDVTPHIWARNATYVITVSGPATLDELRAAAQSLQ